MLLGSAEPLTMPCNCKGMLKKYIIRVLSAEIFFFLIISNFKQ